MKDATIDLKSVWPKLYDNWEFANFQNKRDAEKFATAHSWLKSNVSVAAIPFARVYVVCQLRGDGNIRVLTTDGGWRDVPYKSYKPARVAV